MYTNELFLNNKLKLGVLKSRYLGEASVIITIKKQSKKNKAMKEIQKKINHQLLIISLSNWISILSGQAWVGLGGLR